MAISQVKLPSDEPYWTLVMISQQAITWTNVDLDPCCHMASQGHNELTHPLIVYHIDGLVQERRNSSALALELTHWSYVFLALTHRYHMEAQTKW